MIENLHASLIGVGNITKTHGINGALTAVVREDVDPDEIKCFWMDMDGIMVPFFIENWRERGSEAILVTFEGFDTQESAKILVGKELFVSRDELPETEDDGGFYLSDLKEWNVIADGKQLGTITGYDDSTINVLIHVDTHDGKRILIPAADEFITDIDRDSKTISFELPAGLLDL